MTRARPWRSRPNSASRQKSAQSAQKKRRWRIHPAVFLAGGCVAAAAVLFVSTYTNGVTVTYDGKVLGSLSSEAEAEEARTELERVTAQTLGRSFTIDDSLIQYSSGLLRRQDLVDKETYEEELHFKVEEKRADGFQTQKHWVYFSELQPDAGIECI